MSVEIDYRKLAGLVVDQLLARLDGESVVAHSPRSLTADELADELGMSRSWVYSNAHALGPEPRGSGPRPRLRFDPEKARSAFQAGTTAAPPATPARPRPRRKNGSVDLLPVKGEADMGRKA